VAITRRLHRNGESEYLINQQGVRLKDVHDLFLGTGIGKNAFSIFEQGKLDLVIQYTPLERRAIFEEAAGISRFILRKREAFNKLEQVDQNLTRVRDIDQEIVRQMVILEEQAANALIYKENKSRLENLEKALFALRWSHSHKRLNEISTQELENRQQYEALQSEKNYRTDELSKARKQIQEVEQAVYSKKETLLRVSNTKEIKLQERESHKERLEEVNKALGQRQKQLDEIHQRKEHIHAESQSRQSHWATLESAASESATALRSQREGMKSIEGELASQRKKLQDNSQERVQLLQSTHRLEAQMQQNRIRQEHLIERQTALESRKNDLTELQKDRLQQIEKHVQEQKELDVRIEEQRLNSQIIYDKLKETEKQILLLRSQMDKIQEEISECKARHRFLLRLREEKEGATRGTKQLLKANAHPGSKVHTLLKELYTTLSPEQLAAPHIVESLRHYSQTLIVNTEKDLHTVLEYAKEEKLNDFSLICLEHFSVNAFLERISAVDSVQEAFTLAHKHSHSSIWTKEGYFLDTLGVLFSISKNEQNPFQREAEILSIDQRLTHLNQELAQKQLEIQTLQNQRTQLEQEKKQAEQQLKQYEMKQLEQKIHLNRMQKDAEMSHQEIDKLAKETSTAVQEVQKLQDLFVEYNKEHAVTKNQENALIISFGELSQGVEQLQKKLDQERIILNEKELHHRKATEELKKTEHALQILGVQESECLQQENNCKQELLASDTLKSQLRARILETTNKLKELEQALTDLSIQSQLAEQNLEQEKKIVHTLEERLQNILQLYKQKEDLKNRYEVQKEQWSSNCQHYEKELREHYNLSMEEGLIHITNMEKALPKSPETLERQIKELREKISTAGNVNLASIEDLESNKKRHVLYEDQMKDLEVSKQELIHVITQLDEESRKIFRETFETIRQNFKKNFKILFNGGESDLQFTEASDVLEAGIEIVAQPPGKHMRSITLLSGGEKCMTAIALLFSVFEVNPAPFCILDEIDAPLDDSNVERFVTAVKQFVDRCQFIMITHNKRTMASADVLCGVSMHEKGVSKLLRMEFVKNSAQLAAC